MIDGGIPFLDMHPSHGADIARNGNQGSNPEYFSESRMFRTGPNEALLIMVLQICSYWDQNRECRILTAGKPAWVNPV